MASGALRYGGIGVLREALTEAARTDEENAARTIERFVELRPGHEDTLRARQHHLITGRRGTGKSTLLSVARAHMQEDGAPVAVVDMEKFKKRPFPDVLIEILIDLFDELKPAVRWRSSHLLADVRLRRQFQKSREELREMLNDPQKLTRMVSKTSARGKGKRASAQLATPRAGLPINAGVEGGLDGHSSFAHTNTLSAEFEELKTERLQQLADRLSRELRELVRNSASDRAAIFIDDFYYVRLIDQPQVLDYLKTVTKSAGIWLKVGGVGTRMQPFQQGDPDVGMQINQDIYPLVIDVTLDDFGTAKRFLERMMDGVVKPIGLTTAQLFTDTARDRMVLACGGAVARDYITLTSGALDAAVERLNRGNAPTEDSAVQIQAIDVNSAASKRLNRKEDEELTLDAGEDAAAVKERWRDICDFAREQGNSAFILVRQKDLDEASWGNQIHQLENLRLLHRIRDTVPNTPNWRGVKTVVFLIDLGQLTVKRLQNGIPTFWTATSEFDKLRRAEWVYGPDWRTKLEGKARAKAQPAAKKKAAIPESSADALEADGPSMLFNSPSDLD